MSRSPNFRDLTEYGSSVVTVADRDGGVRAYEVDTSERGEPWLIGPRLIDMLREDQRRTVVTRLPASGMHIDITSSTVALWTTWCWPGVAQAWPDLWTGWSLELWDDRYTEQANRSAGVLTFPDIDAPAELDRYGKRLDDRWLQAMPRRRGYVDDEDGSDFVDLPPEDYHAYRARAVA